MRLNGKGNRTPLGLLLGIALRLLTVDEVRALGLEQLGKQCRRSASAPPGGGGSPHLVNFGTSKTSYECPCPGETGVVGFAILSDVSGRLSLRGIRRGGGGGVGRLRTFLSWSA